MNKILTCIICILLLTSCNKKFPLFNNGNNERFHLNDLSYDNIAIKSKMKYKGDDNLKFTANIRMKKDSAVWFSLSPGFGIEAARGVVDKDSLLILDKIHKEYSVRSMQELFKGFNFNFELSMIESIVIGNLVWHIEHKDRAVKQNGYYQIVQEKGDLRLTSYIGANSMKLEKLLAESINTDNQVMVTYGDFQKEEKAIYPTSIEIEATYYDTKYKKEKSANITMDHLKVEIDKKDYNYHIGIPSKYALKN
ncbi:MULTISPECIES: DUF4292 domain-containing protein [Reichenbachiella]|uniref:DUF4292 domain-containing protein n=1 Tax=Reichenbachiella agariperforans TaxID=156994 RepID=A0A1M6NJ83_REIAG|nr:MULTISPECIES: DUF4292 domain-containing protein [Reichenbachiella]MBU2915896.1 DUF4292 domain-containing protein [Reichenbachiella agariperforans]RJE71847.1 hypothetical protein BGP76_07095 [Reichenbachiella sp. MSK19-1]SHJ95694.1 protein of unknown function [Reichenbachiella agariperforans]